MKQKLHPALPQTYTPENLGVWIKENQIENKDHIKEFPLTDEERHEYEKKVATVTAKIYELQDLEKSFKLTIKSGTPYDKDGETHLPEDFQIPPTKGTKELENNRKFYTTILERGFTSEVIPVFGIPYPEKKVVVFFDAEGKEYEQYGYKMTPEQEVNFGKLFDSEEEELIP
jgi:hypothetical protein